MICAANARYHILIVDDNPDELKLLVELLRGDQFRITLAFDGNQGYRRAVAVAPDLIIMDLRMPHTDGFTACRLLQHNPATAHIPIFFLSAARGMDERLAGLRNGGVDFVLKPFDPAEVLARIHIHLKRLGPRPNVSSTPPVARQKLSAEQMLVNAATAYLAHCLAAPPHLQELARKVGTYEKKLSQAFRKILGKTVFEYLRDERLRIAQGMLNDTTLSITDIAAETGFSTPANFATAFRKQTGITPTEYRRRLAQHPATPDTTPTREAGDDLVRDKP